MDDYGRRVIIDAPFNRAVDEAVRAFQDGGLDIIGRFHVREYLRQTIRQDFRRYVLLQVASPRLMLEALRRDLGVGAILPTTVAIHELADGETAIVASESEQMARALARLSRLSAGHGMARVA